VCFVTLKAIRPVADLSNSLDTLLSRIDQASGLISDFSVIFRALWGSLAPKNVLAEENIPGKWQMATDCSLIR